MVLKKQFLAAWPADLDAHRPSRDSLLASGTGRLPADRFTLVPQLAGGLKSGPIEDLFLSW